MMLFLFNTWEICFSNVSLLVKLLSSTYNNSNVHHSHCSPLQYKTSSSFNTSTYKIPSNNNSIILCTKNTASTVTKQLDAFYMLYFRSNDNKFRCK